MDSEFKPNKLPIVPERGVTLDKLGEDAIKALEQMSPEEREELGQQVDQMDATFSYMVRNKIALTQKAYTELLTFGDRHSLEELGPEELADLPEGFEEWPRTELQVN